MAKKSRGARFRKTRAKVSPSAGKKKSSAPRSSSSLAKKNKGAAKQRVSKNHKQYSKSKQQYRGKKEKYAKQRTMEAQRFQREKEAINANKSLTPEQRRKELTDAQYKRRLREDIIKRKEKRRDEQFQATKQQYDTTQQKEIENYRRRKRAIAYTERQNMRGTPAVAVYNTSYAQQPVYGAYATQPAYGAYATQPTYGAYASPSVYGAAQSYGGQPNYGASQSYGGAPQVPQSSEVPPPQIPYENQDVNGEPTESSPPLQMNTEVLQIDPIIRRSYPASSVVVGVEQVEAEPIYKEIPALSGMNRRAFREFLLARQRYDNAVTLDDKIRYSIEFFDLTEKLDRMFHLHANLWHRVIKFKPKQWSVQDAEEFTDNLTKEQAEELDKYKWNELRDYLKTV